MIKKCDRDFEKGIVLMKNNPYQEKSAPIIKSSSFTFKISILVSKVRHDLWKANVRKWILIFKKPQPRIINPHFYHITSSQPPIHSFNLQKEVAVTPLSEIFAFLLDLLKHPLRSLYYRNLPIGYSKSYTLKSHNRVLHFSISPISSINKTTLSFLKQTL